MRRPFRLRFRTDSAAYGIASYGWPALTGQLLIGSLGGALVREWQSVGSHRYVAVIDLNANSEQQAVDELVVAVGRFGLTVVEVLVTDLVRAAVQRAVVGAFVFGLAGATSRNPLIIGLSALAGSVAETVAKDVIAAWGSPHTSRMNGA